MSATASTYDFDSSFQSKLLGFMLRDTAFNKRAEGLVLPEYFENEAAGTIARLAKDHFDKYGEAGDPITLVRAFKDDIAAGRIRKNVVEDAAEQFKLAIKADLSNRGFMVDKIVEFAKKQAMTNAIIESAELLDKGGSFDDIMKRVGTAYEIGAYEEDEGVDYFATADDRMNLRLSPIAKHKGISTGFPDIDKRLYHNGWGFEELSLLMGGAKAGKSMGLSQFAATACRDGHNVLYITCENSSAIVQDRLDAFFTDTAMKQLEHSAATVASAVKAIWAKAGLFKIHEYSTGTLTPSALRRLLKKYEGAGVSFGMIVVDYADIMAPDVVRNSEREEMKQIYTRLRAIARDFKAAVLTATQTNRGGMKATVATSTDVAEDLNKIRLADIVLSINANDAEKALSEARLHFAASRNSEDGITLHVKQDRSKMKFISKILGVI